MSGLTTSDRIPHRSHEDLRSPPQAFIPPDSVLSSRRPSYASLFPDHPLRRSSNSKSRSRPRHDESYPHSSALFKQDRGIVTSPSLLTARRPSLPDFSYDFPHGARRRASRSHLDSTSSLGGEDEIQEPTVEPASPEDGGNFRRSLQIDMKGLVGDAVGNMSISPASRDVVLAARRGLFIIDLEAPLEVPRFLPQGGTWDVADVQWNPHPSRAEYIVSTSSEKLLIWNLLLVGKTSIEHILHSHYRAITDINWHTTECDTVVSTGLDSWLWGWDLREPRRPIFGLSAFNSGSTQVKWNRQDPNILASSHSKQVLIWDRRKGSLPISRIQAHSSKIYGIDWSHNLRDELVTCSLDKTIKVWDINAFSNPTITRAPAFLSTAYEKRRQPTVFHPKHTIRTTYPVWRARNLPFGEGLLSLAQRGEAALEMYAHSDAWKGEDEQRPVETFEGHTDVVKEFVWRKGGQDGADFQLITWSKDRTLRFWPVDVETMQKVGYVPEERRGRSLPRHEQESTYDTLGHGTISFRNPPEGTELLPALSAPIGTRGILAEVRAGMPPTPTMSQRHLNVNSGMGSHNMNPVMQPHYGSAARGSVLEGIFSTRRAAAAAAAATDGGSGVTAIAHPHVNGGGDGLHLNVLNGNAGKGGTMSRGNLGGKSVARMDAFTWLSNVKVGGTRRESSSPGTRSGGRRSGSREGVERVRDGSKVRERSLLGRPFSEISRVRPGIVRRRSDRSDSRGRAGDVGREVDGGLQNQSLQDEITSVLTKLASSKIKLEKHDLTKKRTCTLGLHGPWGGSSSVFIRVTFTFPRDYPQSVHPLGTPTIELERNPLIALKDRAFMLRRLRAIRERRRPCLEACLRFLLFATEEDHVGVRDLDPGSSSSSDDDGPGGPITRKSRDFTASLLRNNKNLAEPRTTQGVFGPNGELVCFFRAPPRVVRNVLRGTISESVSAPAVTKTLEENQPVAAAEAPQRVYQPPALLSDAVRRLSNAATDRPSSTDLRRNDEQGRDGDILRIMTNLLTYSTQHSQLQHRRDSTGRDVKHFGDGDATRKGHELLLHPARRSTVFITKTAEIAGSDRKVAEGYIFEADSLLEICERNAAVAKEYGRSDHERVFQILRALFPLHRDEDVRLHLQSNYFMANPLAKTVVMRLYSDFAKCKDLQMLAMISMLLLQSRQPLTNSSKSHSNPKSPDGRIMTTTTKIGSVDYFSLTRTLSDRTSASPLWPPPAPVTPSLSSSGSSRGSWSSLFNAGTMRQFMTGMQDTLKEGLTPAEVVLGHSVTSDSGGTIAVPKSAERVGRTPDPQKRRWRDFSAVPSPTTTPTTTTVTSKSWNEGLPSTSSKSMIAFNSAGHRRPVISQKLQVINPPTIIDEKRVLVFEEPPPMKVNDAFDVDFLNQLTCHVHAYAETLFSWKLYHKRLELLKSVNPQLVTLDRTQHSIGLVRTCAQCTVVLSQGANACQSCGLPCSMASCSICRLPVKGLSRSCLKCFHVTHITCWTTLDVPICPTGCGCFCNGLDDDHTTSARLSVRSPPTSTRSIFSSTMLSHPGSVR